MFYSYLILLLSQNHSLFAAKQTVISEYYLQRFIRFFMHGGNILEKTPFASCVHIRTCILIVIMSVVFARRNFNTVFVDNNPYAVKVYSVCFYFGWKARSPTVLETARY